MEPRTELVINPDVKEKQFSITEKYHHGDIYILHELKTGKNVSQKFKAKFMENERAVRFKYNGPGIPPVVLRVVNPMSKWMKPGELLNDDEQIVLIEYQGEFAWSTRKRKDDKEDVKQDKAN